MSTLSLEAMRNYLSLSISSLNQNKLRGLLAEIDLRTYLAGLGFKQRISRGGWIVRTKGPEIFGNRTVALFPEVIVPAADYPENRELPYPDLGLHTICATFHQSGISSFFCAAVIAEADNPASLGWRAIQLGIPVQQAYQPLIERLATAGFTARPTPYNFLRYRTSAPRSCAPRSVVRRRFPTIRAMRTRPSKTWTRRHSSVCGKL